MEKFYYKCKIYDDYDHRHQKSHQPQSLLLLLLFGLCRDINESKCPKAPMTELGNTVRNLARSFTNSPSPDRTPEVVRDLDRARSEAEESIVYVDNARSAYPVANDDDDQDQKYDNPPAYKNRQEARGRQAGKKPKARQSVEHKRIPLTQELEFDAQSYTTRISMASMAGLTELDRVGDTVGR